MMAWSRICQKLARLIKGENAREWLQEIQQYHQYRKSTGGTRGSQVWSKTANTSDPPIPGV